MSLISVRWEKAAKTVGENDDEEDVTGRFAAEGGLSNFSINQSSFLQHA